MCQASNKFPFCDVTPQKPMKGQWEDNIQTLMCKTEHNSLIIEVREPSKWIFQKEHFFFCLVSHWREQWLCITIKKHWWTGNDKHKRKALSRKYWQCLFLYNNKALKIQSFQRSLEWKQNFEKDSNLRSYFKNKLWI